MEATSNASYEKEAGPFFRALAIAITASFSAGRSSPSSARSSPTPPHLACLSAHQRPGEEGVADRGGRLRFADSHVVISPVAGVWVDRINRQKLLVITDALHAAIVRAGVLLLSGRMDIPTLIGLALMQGLINSDRHSRRRRSSSRWWTIASIANAIALNSTMCTARG